ncbi:hypothetical protein GCM10011365_01080 [Marinicella pacifica]|uniref:PAS domain S-box-containing protein/diguanylate cyclase (GGDEF)-like protein n=1 Tax=Marinicella pacifica TaxID=1171543 RepID=A0A917CFN3_9GAMM|nr:EAL domain-containing protein [Marinicella pacifica]GGF83925.1 hypothetical protein GCM10011365_01080 [Marinicella pacifica]
MRIIEVRIVSMMSCKFRLRTYFLYSCILFYSNVLFAEQDVNLQLRWASSFQFAGFYAAQSQNFYQQHDIRVSIQSGFNTYEELISPIEEVLTGRADFGVDDLQLLNTIDNGGQLVVLAPIMQKSATALVTKRGNPVVKIHDLIGKTIKAPDNDHLLNELKVLLGAHKISLDQVHFVHGPIKVKDLNAPEVDVLLTYGLNAEYYAQNNNLSVSVTYLSALGSLFYGNVLFTHRATLDQHPQLVKDFLQASIDGWHYALNHEQEIIAELSDLPNHLVPDTERDLYNRLYAIAMKDYMRWPDVAVGESSLSRWHQIFSDLYNNGLLKGGWNIDDYLYSPQINIGQWGLYLLILSTVVILVFIIVRFNALHEYRHVFLIGLVIILLLYVLIEHNISQSHEQSKRYKALQTAQNLNTMLGNFLNNDVILVKNLAAYIAINPDLDRQEFKAFCTEIFEQGEALINLAAAPDLIIEMIYPLAGNEPALGVDYRQVPSQRDLVFRALREHKTVFSNPTQLIQGGRGVFVRQGVFTSDTKQPWGVASAVIDINTIFEKAGVYKVASEFNLVIETKDINDKKYIVHGNPYYISHESALAVPINIIDNQWKLYISPVSGWSLSAHHLWLLRLMASVLLMTWFFRVRFLLKRKQVRTLIQEEVKTHETLLHEVGTVAKIAAWRINDKGDILQWTAKGNDILGQYVPHKIAHVDDFWELFNNELTESFKKDIMQAALSGEGFDVEVPYIDDKGRKRWLRVVSDQTIETKNGQEIIGAIQDITDYKEISELIQYQATHDSLTDLYNRSAFIHQTRICLQQAEKNHAMAALIFIDLDNFKNINDSLGHGYGDKVLAEFSRIITKMSDPHEIAGRYSGDEFVILTYHTSYSLLKEKVNSLLQHFNQPLFIEGQSIFISASIGVAVYPDHANTASKLMVYADLAMYEAKKRGKNNACIFNVEMQKQAQQQLHLKHALQYHLETESIEVYYQPIINTDNHEVIKIEALMRCPDPAGGYYNTEELIKLCEETSTIFDVDIAVLKQVSEDIESIKGECHHATLGISLNVSPNIFTCQTHLFNEWLFWLYELAGKTNVTLEITERALLNKNSNTMSMFKDFKKRGIEIAIDDFGVGYSSLISLVDFPVSVIKIDRSFVEKLSDKDSQFQLLIHSIVSLANKLNLEVIAEGVETAYQVQQLNQYGCHKLQGYYFSKALNKQAIIEFINKPGFDNTPRLSQE